jgi:hypothetical protein
MWRAIRITILLVILFVAVGVTWSDRTRTTAWTDTLWIGVFPVSADDSPATAAYVATLERDDFADIEEFFVDEAGSYDVGIEQPVKVQLYDAVTELPPALEPGTGPLGTAWWSLKMRAYAWRQASDTPADIRVFVLFHDPERRQAVPHSLGLQKGLIGVVYAWAEPAQRSANNIVIAHEVLHTLGATDKYDPETALPVFPDGYGEPDADPRHPQDFAEIMAGRIALSEDDAEMPASLQQAVVGPATAAEINWVRKPLD